MRWLIAIVVLFVVFCLWLLWCAVVMGIHLVVPFLWGRIPLALSRLLALWSRIWWTQGLADLRGWAF